MNNDINLGLKRKLSPGLSFNKLFEKTSCKKTSLGEGDTFHSVNMIKEHSLKYQHQTKDVASELVKNSPPQTVNSFFRFCYDHFQYAADGVAQNIKSPACAWHSRNKGMDCKSFSVLASTLCSNAGIKHYIRKIKQPFFFPEEFTHVYVIVPIDQIKADIKQGYYIIDATTHDNKEAAYIDKHDTLMEPMPHYGLNGVRTKIYPTNSQEGRNAVNSCGRLKKGYTFNKGGKTINRHGLNGANASEGLQAICELMKALKEGGVSPAITNEIVTRLRDYVSKGIDPEVSISKEAIIINGELFRFTNSSRATITLEDVYIERKNNGLNGTEGEIFSGVLDGIKNEASGWLKSFLSQITGLFTCWTNAPWGPSYSPKLSEKDLKVDMPFMLTWAGLTNKIDKTNLDKFLQVLRGNIADSIHGQLPKFHKCTREGYLLRQKVLEKFETLVIDNIRTNGYKLTASGTKVGNINIPAPGLPGLKKGKAYVWDGYAIPNYTVVNTAGHTGGVTVTPPGTNAPTTPTTPTPPPTPAPKPTTPTPAPRPGTGLTPRPIQIGTNPTSSNASMNWILILALAGGAYMYNQGMFNQTKTTK